MKGLTTDIKSANAPRGIPVTSRGSSGKAARNTRCQCTHGMGYDKATPLPQVYPGSELTPKLVKAAATAEQGSDGWFAARQGRGTNTSAHVLCAVGEAALDALSLSVEDLRAAGDAPAGACILPEQPGDRVRLRSTRGCGSAREDVSQPRCREPCVGNGRALVCLLGALVGRVRAAPGTGDAWRQRCLVWLMPGITMPSFNDALCFCLAPKCLAATMPSVADACC